MSDSNTNKITSLFLHIRNRLSKSVARIVPPDEIEDIVQETYVRICQFEKNQTISHPTTFFFRTARNLALDFINRAEAVRTDQVESEGEFDVIDTWNEDPSHRASSNHEFALFCQAVRQLPLQTRRIYVLKKVYGYSQKEISQRLNMSESTIEKNISRGAKRCAHYMSQFTDYGKIRRRNITPEPSSNSSIDTHVSIQTAGGAKSEKRSLHPKPRSHQR